MTGGLARIGVRPEAAARVLICGDVPVVRDALAALLSSAAGIDVAGTAGNGMEAIVLARRLRPDVVVTDLKPRGIPGTEMVRRLRGEAQVVVFAVSGADQALGDVLHAGASCVLDEDAGPEDLISAVRMAARGQVMLSPAITSRLVNWFVEQRGTQGAAPGPAAASLTPREREVMSLITRGLSAEEIAVKLTIGVATARTHIYRVRCKLGARDRAQIVALAYRSGLAQAPARAAS